MAIDRDAAIKYAKRFWNRVADDDKFWTTNAPVSLATKRKEMNAPATDGWEAFFVSNGKGGEDAVFRRTVGGSVEQKPFPIATWDSLDDCTHYVSRCLLKEGLAITETPRANELVTALIPVSSTKVLAEKTSKQQGQRVVESGIFKPGDMVGYYTQKKGRYTHTAMYVGTQSGKAGDPGGITCHTVCRFEGLTEAWNGGTDDAWFLYELDGFFYTLIHFSEDDEALTPATLKWLPGWWKLGSQYYDVLPNGRAHATGVAPKSKQEQPLKGFGSAHYFQVKNEIVFVWNKRGGEIQVEHWTTGKTEQEATVQIDGIQVSATRIVFKR